MKELLFVFFSETVHSFVHVVDVVFHVAHYLLHFGTVRPPNFDLFLFSYLQRQHFSFSFKFLSKGFHLILIFYVKAYFN